MLQNVEYFSNGLLCNKLFLREMKVSVLTKTILKCISDPTYYKLRGETHFYDK